MGKMQKRGKNEWTETYQLDVGYPEGGKEVGGGVFPAAPYKVAAAAWWGTLDNEQRMHWTTRGIADCNGNAYLSYLREDAWHDAAQTAGEWLDSRPKA